MCASRSHANAMSTIHSHTQTVELPTRIINPDLPTKDIIKTMSLSLQHPNAYPFYNTNVLPTSTSPITSYYSLPSNTVADRSLQADHEIGHMGEPLVATTSSPFPNRILKHPSNIPTHQLLLA